MADKVIVLFSGGIDSTAALHRCLTGYHDLDVVVFHATLIGREDRHEAESVAVREILKWYKKNDQSKDFEYHEMTLDSRKSIFPWDTEVAFMMAGMIAQRDHNIKWYASGDRAIYGPSTRETSHVLNIHATVQQDRKYLECLEVFRSEDGSFLTKSQAWEIIPNDIREFVWTCRRPIYKINRKTWKNWCADACGECRSCKEASHLPLTKWLILTDYRG